MKDNKIKIFLLAFLITVISLPVIVFADSREYNGLIYYDYGNYVHITGVNENVPTVVEIPSYIDGKKVSSIYGINGEYGDKIEKIIIPSDIDINYIGQNAFEGMDSLVTVEIYANIKTIESEAFANCPKLREVILPDSLNYIYNGAFYNDVSLESITIPDNVYDLGGGAFRGHGVFQNCYNLKEVKLPSNLQTIGTRAFYKTTSLSKITLPELKVQTQDYNIGDEAFAYSGLTEIEIPYSYYRLNHLGEYLFYKCKNLKKVTFLGKDDYRLVISTGMFEDCINLKIVNFNDNNLYIGDYSFKGTTSLETIDLSKASYIGDEAFAYSGVKNIALTAEKIGNSAFINSSLETVEMNLNYFEKIGDLAFANCKNLNKFTLRSYVNEDDLGNNIFKNTNVTLYTRENDYIKKYAEQNNIKYVFLDEASSREIDSIPVQKYTGKEIKPKVIVRVKDKVLVEGVDYEVTYSNNIEVGQGQIYIKGKGIYDFQNWNSFYIEKNLDDGLHLNSSYDFEYFKNGKIDTTFTGIVEYNDSERQYLNGLYYVKNGIVDSAYTDLVYHKGEWRYVSGGKVDDSYTGLATNKNGTYYVQQGEISFAYSGSWLSDYCVSKDNCSEAFILKNSKVDTDANGLKYLFGKWYYFKRGMVDSNYSGFFTNKNGTYYVSNGKVNFDYNGLVYYNKKWTPVVNSKVNNNYTGVLANKNGKYLTQKGEITFKYNGFYKEGNKVYKIKNSKVDTTFTGLKSFNGTWYYFVKGENALDYTGYASNSNGTYYVQKGIITFKYNELVKYNGKWTAIVNSKVVPNYTGISSNRQGNYYLENGVLSFKYNGTYKASTGDIYTFKNSRQDVDFTGLKLVNDTWYYFEKGVTDYTYTGYANNSNGTYYVEKGKITFKYNGLVYYNGKWTAIVKSKIQPKYTGLSTNKNGTYYLKNGEVQFGFSGTVTLNGKTYTIVNGKVKM